MSEDRLLSISESIVAAAEAEQKQRTKANDLVERFFSQDVPAELWHYTTVSGFKGILETGTVWATEARYTTDKSEFVYARKIALEYLENFPAPTDALRHAKSFVAKLTEEDFWTGALSEDQTEVFVASFSSAKDLKSQWNEYAAEETGVSVAFDLRTIRPPRDMHSAAMHIRLRRDEATS